MKRFLAVFLAALMLFTLAACGAKEEETTAPPETTTEETTTSAPAEGEPIATPNGYATIKESGNWEYKGEYSSTMIQFADKTVPGSMIYISEKQGLEATKKSVEYAYTDKAFEEVKIGDNTYSFMQAKDNMAYLIAPTSAEGDFCLYIQINGGTLEDAKPLIETIVIK